MKYVKLIFILCGLGLASIPIYSRAQDTLQIGEYLIKIAPSSKPLQEQGHAYDRQPWSCVFDPRTGLTWEIKTRDGGLRDQHHAYSWNLPDESKGITPGSERSVLCNNAICNTLDYISAINQQGLCGLRDWRLPSRWELATLVDYATTVEATAIARNWFPNTVHEFYWTSTVDARDPNYAWGIGFRFGFDYSYPKASPGRIRLVSGPLYISDTACASTATDMRFVVSGEDIVIDKRTGLRWRRCSLGQRWVNNQCIGTAITSTLSETERLLQSLTSARGTWALPEVSELQTLMHTPCNAAAIDTHAFPGTTAAAYWSRTPFASDPARQWVVNFVFGENDTLTHDDTAYIRPVLRQP